MSVIGHDLAQVEMESMMMTMVIMMMAKIMMIDWDHLGNV